MKPAFLRPVAVIAVGVVLGLLISPLSGCSPERSVLYRTFENLVGAEQGLPEDAQRQLARFDAVFDVHLKEKRERDLQRDLFIEVYKHTRRNYVHPVDDAALIDAAIKGMEDYDPNRSKAADTKDDENLHHAESRVEAALDSMLASLDPHSSYLTPKEAAAMYDNTRGEFGGLGISVTMRDQGVYVIAPISDTPAEKAGVKAGDVITHLDGRPLKGWTLMRAVDEMRGKPGTKITLTIQRKEQTPFNVSIVRDIIEVETVKARLEGSIGYLRVTKFNEKVMDETEAAVERLLDESQGRLTGFVLDLRNNPGGLLDQSVALADAFLEKGRIVSIRGRDGRGERHFEAGSGDIAKGIPMVVLINSGSASASEIVSSALQEHHRAVVMGRRSFGKGSVQTLLPLSNDGSLRLTTQLYYAPSGKTIQANGVVPDIDLVVREKEGEEDAEGPRREADLEHAIKVSNESATQSAIKVDAESCTPIVTKVAEEEQKDFDLGCALSFLRVGSQASFLASVKPL